MKYLLCVVLLLSSCLCVLSRSASKDEIDIVGLLKERFKLPQTVESNKELLDKLGLSQKSTWEKTKELLGKSEEQYIVENLKTRMGLPQDDKSNIILKDELLGLPSFQIPQRTWLQRLGDMFGLGRKSMKERLYDALGGAAALELLRRSTSDIAGQATRKVGDTMEGLKEKAYEKIGDNVAGTLKQKGHNLKETIVCDTKECATKMSEHATPSPGLLWGMLSYMSYTVFGNRTVAKEPSTCEGEYYSAKECAKEKAKETLESAKETVKCTAEMAKDKLCDVRDSVLERGSEAVHAAQAATHRVEDVYETAKEKVGEKAKEAYEGAKDKTKEVLEGAKDKTKEALEGAKDKTKEVLEGAKDRTREVYEGTKEKAKDAYEGAKDMYEDVKSKGKERVEDVRDTASNIYEGTKEGARRAYEGVKETAEGAKETASRLRDQAGEKYQEAKETLSEKRDEFMRKIDLSRDDTQIVDNLRTRLGLSSDTSYPDLLERLGYGREMLPGSSRVNLTPEEMRVVERLNEFHSSYRRKPALEQFKENIGYNEEVRRPVRHEHLREHTMEGKVFPEDISGFGDVINEQKTLKGKIPA